MSTTAIDPQTGEITHEPFNPSRFLTLIKGQQYLEVKWRIAWYRDLHPDGVITTELHSLESGRAIFSAHVTIPGGGSATGWGTSTADEFADGYIEKAETKAIGRALAALGFGTQFCDDFADGAGPIADAPVATGTGPGPGPNRGGGDAPATDAQRSMIRYKQKTAGLDEARLATIITERIHPQATLDQLTKRDASRLIDMLGELPAANG